MNYKNNWLSACFGSGVPGGLINVKFRGDAEEQPFTMTVFPAKRDVSVGRSFPMSFSSQMNPLVHSQSQVDNNLRPLKIPPVPYPGF